MCRDRRRSRPRGPSGVPEYLTPDVVLLCCNASDYYYRPFNVTRTTLSGIAAYRSSLTLDWLAAEDSRQRELAAVFETEHPPARIINTDCIDFPRPSAGKIGRYILELLRHLEGDNGVIIQELIQLLIRSKILVETSSLEAEPDLESLVKTPEIMVGQPHATFPRIVALVWMSVTDPSNVRKYGWCSVSKVNQFLKSSKPRDVARRMQVLDMVVDRARFIMDDFIQHVTPVYMYQSRKPHEKVPTLTRVSPIKTVAKEHKKLCCEASRLDLVDPEFTHEDRWVYRNAKSFEPNESCARVRPSSRDLVKRFNSIVTYFDRDRSNTEFLRKYRATVYSMSEGEDPLDKEVAFYAAALTPLIFLQNYKSTWCLLERFHRALRLYQNSHPTDKRPELKLLQGFRAVNQKVLNIIGELPGAPSKPQSSYTNEEDEDVIDKKGTNRYIAEIIKNFG